MNFFYPEINFNFISSNIGVLSFVRLFVHISLLFCKNKKLYIIQISDRYGNMYEKNKKRELHEHQPSCPFCHLLHITVLGVQYFFFATLSRNKQLLSCSILFIASHGRENQHSFSKVSGKPRGF